MTDTVDEASDRLDHRLLLAPCRLHQEPLWDLGRHAL